MLLEVHGEAGRYSRVEQDIEETVRAVLQCFFILRMCHEEYCWAVRKAKNYALLVPEKITTGLG